MIKLPVVKKLINTAVRRLLPVIPEREARLPATKLVDEVFGELERCARREARRNNGDNAYKDGNFLRFVAATRKSLVYLMENDPVYYHWANYALTRLNEKVSETASS